MIRPGDEPTVDRASWTLLTGHGHVLVAIAKNPEARIRDLSQEAGLTERATLTILNDLEAAGYITRHRHGRRTNYTVHVDRGFRHQSQGGLQIGPFLELLVQGTSDAGETDGQFAAMGGG
jgi:predicted transcriptional regulator